MSQMPGDRETLLLVDDEESVRTTFGDWLKEGHLNSEILVAADAETALTLANQQSIDLAILDWNLGAGNDGLKLLEDLYLFHPDLVAIMITGYAHQATPLDAMRMGVRDYLDKNQKLDRETFLRTVRRQLDRIRPAKRERKFHQSLAAFRASVEKILPLVQSTAALNDPVPLPRAIHSFMTFVIQITGAQKGVLFLQGRSSEFPDQEDYRAYADTGERLQESLVPFSRSVAGTVVSMGQPCSMEDLQKISKSQAVELQPFEKGHQTLLAAPLLVAPGINAVIELFDKRAMPAGFKVQPFTEGDQKLLRAVANFGVEMLRQALAERQTHRLLFDAVGAALQASDSVVNTLQESGSASPEDRAPFRVMEQLQEGLKATPDTPFLPEEALRLAEAVRVLALHHGPLAVKHCLRLVESLRELLDATANGVDIGEPSANL